MALEVPNLSIIQSEDLINDQFKTIPYRFGVKIPCNLTPATCGNWQESDNHFTWTMRFTAKDAKSLHFNFSEFALIEQDKIWVYNDNHTIAYGPYTALNNTTDSIFSSFLITGESINIRFESSIKNRIPFVIESITYGYRSIGDFILKNFGASGACETNINCPLGDDWQKEKRSVALILVNGNGWCTGSLLNNTLQDTTPYILTANHCSSSSYSNWQFAFNWEAPGCGPQLAPMNQVMAGATYIASSALSDFLLVKLNSKVPDSFHPYFNGWDFQNIAPDTVVCIHHPSGDIKKISVANNTCQDSSYFNAFCWKIGQWDNGVTEGGSSGAPLYNNDHEVVGTLTGGPSFCCASMSDRHDYFGKFAVAWNMDTAIHHQLSYWLNPNSLPIFQLSPFDPFQPNNVFSTNVHLKSINQVQATAFTCKDSNSLNIHFTNEGSTILNSLEIKVKVNLQAVKTYNWNGALNPGQSTDLILYQINGLAPGPNDVILWSRLPNGIPDQFPSNDTLKLTYNYIFGSSLRLHIQTDNLGSETIWKIKNNAGTLFYAGGPYQNILGGQSIYENICLVPGCYQLSVEDLGGDGMCCINGNGSFSLTNADNKQIVSGSQFTCAIQGNFCVNANEVITLKNNEEQPFHFYPNPANSTIQLSANIQTVFLLNAIGQQYNLNLKEDHSAEISEIPSGNYMLVGNNKLLGKLVIQH